MKSTALLLLGSFLLAGCASERMSTPNAEGEQGVFKLAADHDVSTREYRVDPPDEIIVKAPSIKELDGQRQKVRPDGKISLNLVGEVYVAGMSPTQINELLQKLTRQYYTNADVKVEVIANSKFYYVFGKGVQNQGKFAYTGRDTVVTALAEAGFGEDAWPQQVSVSRPARGEQQTNATAIVDFKKVWSTGDLSQNYLVEEGDIIEITDSPLWRFNEKTRLIFGPITGAAGVAGSAASVTSQNGGRSVSY